MFPCWFIWIQVKGRTRLDIRAHHKGNVSTWLRNLSFIEQSGAGSAFLADLFFQWTCCWLVTCWLLCRRRSLQKRIWPAIKAFPDLSIKRGGGIVQLHLHVSLVSHTICLRKQQVIEKHTIFKPLQVRQKRLLELLTLEQDIMDKFRWDEAAGGAQLDCVHPMPSFFRSLSKPQVKHRQHGAKPARARPSSAPDGHDATAVRAVAATASGECRAAGTTTPTTTTSTTTVPQSAAWPRWRLSWRLQPGTQPPLHKTGNATMLAARWIEFCLGIAAKTLYICILSCAIKLWFLNWCYNLVYRSDMVSERCPFGNSHAL